MREINIYKNPPKIVDHEIAFLYGLIGLLIFGFIMFTCIFISN